MKISQLKYSFSTIFLMIKSNNLASNINIHEERGLQKNHNLGVSGDTTRYDSQIAHAEASVAPHIDQTHDAR